jgi:hypothetical protein
MRIFNSPDGDPMLLDTVQGMEELKKEFNKYVQSSVKDASFTAETTGKSEPYDEFLNGLRVQKSKETTQLRISEDNWLELMASESGLIEFELQLGVDEGGDHNHFYCSPVSLIIEVDESWPGWDES